MFQIAVLLILVVVGGVIILNNTHPTLLSDIKEEWIGIFSTYKMTIYTWLYDLAIWTLHLPE